jgi:hypothetical protein
VAARVVQKFRGTTADVVSRVMVDRYVSGLG